MLVPGIKDSDQYGLDGIVDIDVPSRMMTPFANRPSIVFVLMRCCQTPPQRYLQHPPHRARFYFLVHWLAILDIRAQYYMKASTTS
jgi:hypothetical protein